MHSTLKRAKENPEEASSAVSYLFSECARLACSKAGCDLVEQLRSEGAHHQIGHILIHHREFFGYAHKLGQTSSITGCLFPDCEFDLPDAKEVRRKRTSMLREHYLTYHSPTARLCYVCRALFPRGSTAELRHHLQAEHGCCSGAVLVPGRQGAIGPLKSSQGGGRPSEGSQGGGRPVEGSQGGSRPVEGSQGGGRTSQVSQGGGGPVEGSQGGGRPSEGSQGGGCPVEGSQRGGDAGGTGPGQERRSFTYLTIKCPYCEHTERSGFHRTITRRVTQRSEAHVRSEHGKNERLCNMCLEFLPESDLVPHKEAGCAGRRCSHCDYRSLSLKNLHRHIRNIHCMRRQGRACRRCGELVRGGAQNRHKCVVGGELRMHPCRKCDMKFPTAHALGRHTFYTHSAKRYTYTCPNCGTSFRNSCILRRHISDVHEKERHHECPVCEQKFSQKSSMRRHMLIHLKMKPHLCQHCGDSFRQKVLLRHHMKKQHPGEPVE